MTDKIITLLKQACKDDTKFKYLSSIYELYSQLQYAKDIESMIDDLHSWLRKDYKIDNISVALYNTETKHTHTMLQTGSKIILDDKFSFYFVINTHIHINALVSFSVNTEKQYNFIHKHKYYLDIAFYHISPILQNGIMKKHHIEASSIDSVTKVYTRQYLIEHINKIITLSDKTHNITFLMIGIDRFKAVIEEFDYDIGDKVLIELAKVIYGNIKRFDIVARLTGDEFVVALLNLPDIKYASAVAQRIITAFENLEIKIDEKTVLKKTISVGISSYPHDSDNITQVLKNADAFLVEAKNKGRGQIAIYNSDDFSSVEMF